jgi:hypothetical protein
MAAINRMTNAQKLSLLKEVFDRHEDIITSGKFNATRTAESIKSKWCEVYEFARINAFPFVSPERDWTYIRDTVWPNFKKATKVR